MGILDKLGIRKKADKKGALDEKVTAKNVQAQKDLPEPKAKEVSKAERKAKSSRAYEILMQPILSEKATHMASVGKYVFSVNTGANKSEIRKSIKQVYDVDPVSINIVKMPGKMRRYGKSVGITSNWKKAIITLKPGDKISGIIEAVG